MRIFDTDVQKLKYDILREVARYAYEDRLLDGLTEIPKIIAPGPKPTMRCCIYKERAIVSERLKLAMGGDKDNPNTMRMPSTYQGPRFPEEARAFCSAPRGQAPMAPGQE